VSARLVEDPAQASVTYGLGLCVSGKYRYDTCPSADRGQNAFLRKTNKKLEIYRCDECHGWHLGSSLSGGRSR